MNSLTSRFKQEHIKLKNSHEAHIGQTQSHVAKPMEYPKVIALEMAKNPANMAT